MTDLTHLLLALRAQIVDSEGPIKIGPYTVDRRADGAWCATRGGITSAISRTRLGSATIVVTELAMLSSADLPPCRACNEQPAILGLDICLPCELRS